MLQKKILERRTRSYVHSSQENRNLDSEKFSQWCAKCFWHI